MLQFSKELSVPPASNASGKESACQCKRHRFDPWVRKILRRRKWHSTPVFLPGKSHGQRSLVGHTQFMGPQWGVKETFLITASVFNQLFVEAWRNFFFLQCLVSLWIVWKDNMKFSSAPESPLIFISTESGFRVQIFLWERSYQNNSYNVPFGWLKKLYIKVYYLKLHRVLYGSILSKLL